MPETERSIEDLRALYRSLGMSEETLERAIQFGSIKAPEKMVKPRPLSGDTLAKRPEGRKRTQSAPAAVSQEPAQRALALKQRPGSQILAVKLKKDRTPIGTPGHRAQKQSALSAIQVNLCPRRGPVRR